MYEIPRNDLIGYNAWKKLRFLCSSWRLKVLMPQLLHNMPRLSLRKKKLVQHLFFKINCMVQQNLSYFKYDFIYFLHSKIVCVNVNTSLLYEKVVLSKHWANRYLQEHYFSLLLRVFMIPWCWVLSAKQLICSNIFDICMF